MVGIDIGNSCTDIALFEQGTLLEKAYLPSQARSMESLCNFLLRWNARSEIQNVVIASVVPSLGDLLMTLIEDKLSISPTIVNDYKLELMPIIVDRPDTVGVDRLINCYAAMRLYGAPAIVVSLGTATTFEVISANQEYLGGSICPGIQLSLNALSEKTALLPPAKLDKPENIIAKNTLDHMRSGIYYGTVSMIEGMVKRIEDQLRENLPLEVIGTGGLSPILAQEKVFTHLEPSLTLKGLELFCRDKICASD